MAEYRKTDNEAKKKEKTLDTWIREKQSGTYVHIDDTYLNCNFKYKGWMK